MRNTFTLTRPVVVIAALLTASASLIAADDINAIKEQLNWEILARTTAQIQQLQQAAQQVSKERNDALQNLCTAHNVKFDECLVNEGQKQVSKKESEAAAPKSNVDSKAKEK